MTDKHYMQAVALEYGRNKAPTVTAKGDDELARRIVARACSPGMKSLNNFYASA